MDRLHAEALIRRHEGVRNKVYLDTKGNRTIGVGCNLESPYARARIAALGVVDVGLVLAGDLTLTDTQVNALFEDDFQMACDLARKYVRNFEEQPDLIQSVIVDMCFNLGNRFGQFSNTIAGFVAKDYKAAANHMEDSLWYAQTGIRALDNVTIVRSFDGPRKG